jgi:hypothetical protein
VPVTARQDFWRCGRHQTIPALNNSTAVTRHQRPQKTSYAEPVSVPVPGQRMFTAHAIWGRSACGMASQPGRPHSNDLLIGWPRRHSSGEPLTMWHWNWNLNLPTTAGEMALARRQAAKDDVINGSKAIGSGPSYVALACCRGLHSCHLRGELTRRPPRESVRPSE